MPDLVVVVPSRGRPDEFAELCGACRAMCTADTVLLGVVDVDDPTASQYLATADSRVFLTRAPADCGHVGAVNWGALQALDQFRPFAVGKLDDDHRPRTKGWDQLLLAELRGMGTGIVYGNDLLQGARLPTAPVLSADIVRALGWMGPSVLRHLFVDNFWHDLGEAAGCLRYLSGVIVEHMHPVAGKAPWTEGHLRANAPEMYVRDRAAYETYKAGRFAGDVAKVQALCLASEGMRHVRA